jgi:acyl-coenzyme A synthetase/AMP-(fatty) acid ligase
MDADGYVTLRGRLAERVVVDGEIWFPRDIEEALLGHPAVRQAALVGVPDPELGQRPIAYVTLYEPDPAGADTALAHAARVLQRNLDVIVVKVVDELPMTPTGKIAKAELTARAMIEVR